MNKVLIIGREESARLMLADCLGKGGYSTLQARDGLPALKLFKKHRPDAVLLDNMVADMDWLEVLARLKKTDPGVPVIIISDWEVHLAAKAVKAGAYNFVSKPVNPDALLHAVNGGMEKLELERKVKRLQTAVGGSLEYLMGRGALVKKVINDVTRVAASDFSIIIQGETGSGKSVLAEAIHNMSERSGEAFVRVDLGAIPETLVESELFGYDKGAFTGAVSSKEGFFCSADKGTIFLDELENTPHAMQVKLLGVVERKKVYPVGSTKPVDVDVRIISATNTDLKKLVGRKLFREDLFFRLGEFMVNLPPLRERTEDIEFFARRFCRMACMELKKPVAELPEATLELLAGHTWPGNIRELKNVIRRAVLLTSEPVIMPDHIDFIMEGEGSGDGLPGGALLPLKEISSKAAEGAERTGIIRALELCGGNKSRAASILKVDYKTLLTKIKKYGI